MFGELPPSQTVWVLNDPLPLLVQSINTLITKPIIYAIVHVEPQESCCPGTVMGLPAQAYNRNADQPDLRVQFSLSVCKTHCKRQYSLVAIANVEIVLLTSYERVRA